MSDITETLTKSKLKNLKNISKKDTTKFSFDGRKVFAKVLNCYDGDTITLAFYPFEDDKIYSFNCRCLGYNCAEIKSKDLQEKEKAKLAKEHICSRILDKIVVAKLGDFDKYGRILVTIFCDGVNINQEMIDKNHGKFYDGDGEKLW